MKASRKANGGFRMPHVFIILLVMMLAVVILSYLIPSGSYTRVVDEATNITVVVPGTFQYVENETPITFMNYFEAVYQGFVNGASIMATLFISSGVIYLLEVNGAFSAGINIILRRTKGREFSVIFLFYSIFVLFGVLGFGEAAYPFYPLAVSIGFSLGYDRVAGAGMAIVGSTVGFTSGLINVFTTGVSQQIVGLPLFSGIGFRTVGLAVFYVIGLVGLYRYCKKIKRDPSLSIVREEYEAQNGQQSDGEADMEEMTPARGLGLLAFLAVIVVQGVGCIKLNWSFPQIGAIYVILGVLLTVIFRINPSEACNLFCQGALRVFAAAFAVGLAQSVVVLMNQARIMDTIVHAMSVLLENKGAILALLIIFLFVTLFNFLVVSGSGKAVIIMPILQPLGELLNINQQILVLTYQYGDGITNSFWPGSSLVQLSMCGLDYGSWLKFCWKIYLSFIVSAFALIMVANAIGYGPF
ncbi:YfcC family protein [Pseudoflavonifractor phocaeensis]|uniref:YfcC family protein n=1 Tax=Pseudoflavonifractor phocaeensis TaxID=1870988 RepID=UPI001959A38F|nr:AbgT family transporter [Pseudoflavonifractor phocaeensis]MBM6937927.1 YfcC family protein [Pseudoflavonifractor phocaeensis]